MESYFSRIIKVFSVVKKHSLGCDHINSCIKILCFTYASVSEAPRYKGYPVHCAVMNFIDLKGRKAGSTSHSC